MKRSTSKKVSKKSNKKVSKKPSNKVKLEQSNYKYIPVDSIVIENWNYKKKNETLQKKLEQNIKKNGQIENLLVRNLGDGTYGLVNGHHRLDALKALNMKDAFIYDLGEISLNLAKRIGVETNETKFETDPIQLAELLSELTDDFGLNDLDTTMPFSENEMENFSKMLDFDWEDDKKEDEDEKEAGAKSSTMVSAGGEKFRTVRLELEPDLAERFENQLVRLKKISGGSSEKTVKTILDFLDAYTPKEIEKKIKG